LQTKRAKIFLAELTVQAARDLVSVLVGTLFDKAAVEVGVLVHKLIK
jgi:hypothetical protein